MTIDRPLVFVHIPKAAGSTVAGLLTPLFESGDIFHTGRQDMAHWEASLAFARLPEAERARCRFLTGHLEMAAVEAVPGDPFVFTFLREPLARIISLYRFVRRTPTHHLHSFVVDNGLDLAGFVRSHPWDELHNGLTRRLAGVVGPSIPPYDESLLKRALRTLEYRFEFVGLQESFDKSLFLLGRRLGLTPGDLLYTSRNTAPAKERFEGPDDDARRVVREHNRMDAVLYDHARERFRSLAREIKGPLGKEFDRFRKRLRAHGKEREDRTSLAA